MEKFPDGQHVRLRSREHGGYLHADEDGIGVSLSWGLISSSMAWKVHRILHDGSTSVLLHSVSLDVADHESTLMHWKVETIPTSLTLPPPPPEAVAMELFPYGALVRLQSRVHGGYLHADEDGMGVSLGGHLGETSAAWKVHRVLHDGSIGIRLQSAAHGRYLALAASSEPPGHRAHRVVQADCDRNVGCILWEAVGTGDAGYVLLRHVSNRLLRANGSHGGVFESWSHAALGLGHPSDIVVPHTSSPAAMGLRHPNVDAPEPPPGIWEEY